MTTPQPQSIEKQIEQIWLDVHAMSSWEQQKQLFIKKTIALLTTSNREARMDEVKRLPKTLSSVVFDMNQQLFMAKARDDRLAELATLKGEKV